MSFPPSPLHTPPSSRPRRIAVIGGGIAGLAAAHRLIALEPATEVTLFEANNRVGGVLQTEQIDGYLIERSADSFITNMPWGVELCREVGLDGELLETEPTRRRALVVRDWRLYPVPAGFQLLTPSQLWPLATTPLLSLRGKLRALREFFVAPRTDDGDESLASFAVRRFGREAFERLIQPLVAGIYTADPEQLSMQAALPKFYELERKYGSLTRAARHIGGGEGTAAKQASGARYGLFVAPRLGMQQLVVAVAAKLPAGCVRLNTPVRRLEKTSDGWSLEVDGRPPEKFDAVIVALPAPAAAKLLGTVDGALAAELGDIPYAGTAIVISGYERKQIEHPLDAFGFVVPDVEEWSILAASFSSQKFPGRAPEGCVLIRSFLGGALRPRLVDESDDDLRHHVNCELKELLKIQGEPHLFQVHRWSGAMPQYHLGHTQRVARIQARVDELSGLALAGNAYSGVGLPQCIRSGRQAAERLLGA